MVHRWPKQLIKFYILEQLSSDSLPAAHIYKPTILFSCCGNYIVLILHVHVYCCCCFFMSNITFQHAFETSQNIKTMEQKLLDFKMNPQKHLHLLNLNLLPRIQQLVPLFFPIIPIRSVCSPSLAELS